MKTRFLIFLCITLSSLGVCAFAYAQMPRYYQDQVQGGARLLSPHEFEGLKGDILHQSFDSDRKYVIKEAVNEDGVSFTVDQTIELMKIFPYDSDKIDVAVIVYPTVYDIENWRSVGYALEYASNREELKKRLAGVQHRDLQFVQPAPLVVSPRPVVPMPPVPRPVVPMPGPRHVVVPPPHSPVHVIHEPVVMPMSEGEFASLYRSVESATFSDSRLDVIRSAVRSGNILTVSQTVRLLKLLDFDKDRVEAGSIICRTVYDFKNWYQVYEAFDFDSSKDELRKRCQ